MGVVITISYILWSIYAGWKFINGRWAFLERSGVVYKILKFTCIFFVGIFYGAIYFFVLIGKFIDFMEHQF